MTSGARLHVRATQSCDWVARPLGRPVVERRSARTLRAHRRTAFAVLTAEPRSAFVSLNVKQSSILAWCRVPFVCRALGDVPSSCWLPTKRVRSEERRGGEEGRAPGL